MSYEKWTSSSRQKKRQEEEHFRKLDTLIRQQQANRKEAAREHPLGRLKNMFNHC